jgi:hypothetical protein
VLDAAPPTGHPGHCRPARLGAAIATTVATALLVGACTGGGRGDDGAVPPAIGRPASGPSVPPPALVGGLDLEPVDPAAVLVGDGLAYGSTLPSVVAALDTHRDEAEVSDALVRDVRDAATAEVLVRVTVLRLDGGAFFDEVALAGYVDGLLAAATDTAVPETAPEPVPIAGTEVRRAASRERSAAAWQLGDLLVVVEGAAERVDEVLVRSLAAVAEGRVGTVDPITPLPPPAEGSPLVSVPSVEFVPFPPVEEEPEPEPPVLAGGLVIDGRIGVVGGERRATVWVVATDTAAFSTVEVLELATAGMVQGRAGGAAVRTTEVLGRVVLAADGSDGAPSARAFRQGRTVLLVEGADPGQLDAVVSAWLAVLPPAP